jgi:hypothetical protein
MKKVIFLLIVNSLGLSVFAQAFTIDSSFAPNFDIRLNTNISISGLFELSSSKVILQGQIRLNYAGNVYQGILSSARQGDLIPGFRVLNGNGYSTDFQKINSNEFYFGVGNSNGKLIDSSGFDIKPYWQTNFFKTVRCFQGKPFFYPDGSSIFPNGFSQTANGPCPIENPPDTFPGMYLVKVTPQGLWDSTFRAFPNYSPNGVVRYDSTRLLVYGFPGRFTHYNGVRVNGLCRIFADGSLDTTFQSPLKDTLDGDFGPVLVDSLGRIFIVGRYFLDDGTLIYKTIVRLHSDGSIDSTFNTNSAFSAINTFYSVQTVAETEDNGYLVGGSFDSYQNVQKNNIVKIDATGNLETQYFTGIGPDSSYLSSSFPNFAPVTKILKSKFGGYYVAGYFLKWDGQPSQPIVRIHDLNTTVGLNEIGRRAEPRSEVSVYPNPTTGIFRIESELAFRSVEVFDLIGGLVHSERSSSVFSGTSIHSEESEYSASEKKYRDTLFFNLTNFDAGIYFLKIELENGELVMKKVVRQ